MLEPVDRMPTAPAIPPIGVAAAGKAITDTANSISDQFDDGGSGGYVFSPEEIDEVIKQWEELLDDIMQDEDHVRTIATVQAPGREFASGDFKDAAGPSGEMLAEQTKRMRRYVSAYINALKNAKHATQAQDQQAAGTARDAGGELT